MKNTSEFYNSPIGLIKITCNAEGVTSIVFDENEENENISLKTNDKFLNMNECIKQIDEYFKGKRDIFTVKLAPEGTDFQKAVWNELKTISFGKTCSYLDIAKKIGKNTGSRAVGNANGKNPISIIIPCHRVIGSDKKLTGYAGGIWRKKWLLEHEQRVLWHKRFGIITS
ncbi:MAG: methylated-DNA--[protein]-cysteine S-methyltransferase [Candidatus Hodarchaeales archaeon]|jgi:methylated-DNA-[protein]-cysteine S-methyltransferase